MHVEGWSPNSAHLDLRNVDTDLGVDKLQVDQLGSYEPFFVVLQLPHDGSRRTGVVKHWAVIRVLRYQRLASLGANQSILVARV